jgi:hypothetical protein
LYSDLTRLELESQHKLFENETSPIFSGEKEEEMNCYIAGRGKNTGGGFIIRKYHTNTRRNVITFSGNFKSTEPLQTSHLECRKEKSITEESINNFRRKIAQKDWP